MLKKSYKREIGLTIMLIVCLCSLSLAQGRIDSPSFITRGRCIDIFSVINDSTKNDSIAIQKFIRYYKFENGISFTISQWRGALLYITKKENNQLFCLLRESMHELDLIGDPAKDAEAMKLKSIPDSLRK